jgi:hypothetical protein
MAKPPLNSTKVAFQCEVLVLEGLKWLAESRGTSVAELLRLAARQYVSAELRKETDILAVLSAASALQSDAQ